MTETSRKSTRRVRIGFSEPPVFGEVFLQTWSGKARIKRGFRRSFKICMIVLGVMLPFAVLEPFLFMFWGGAGLFFVVAVLGPLLFMRYVGEQTTFSEVRARCPRCTQTEQPLRPYVSEAYKDDSEGFVVICPKCGETQTVTADGT